MSEVATLAPTYNTLRDIYVYVLKQLTELCSYVNLLKKCEHTFQFRKVFFHRK